MAITKRSHIFQTIILGIYVFGGVYLLRPALASYPLLEMSPSRGWEHEKTFFQSHGICNFLGGYINNI